MIEKKIMTAGIMENPHEKLVMCIKNIPNILTAARIILSIFILTAAPLSPLFFTIYIGCGVTDILDGYIARKTKTTSRIGAIFDSIADFIFISASLFKIIPAIVIPLWVLIWIFIIAFVRIASLIVGYRKYHTLCFLHTYANKAAGIVLFCSLFLYAAAGIVITAFIACIAASISCLEELAINITSAKLDRNIKSIISI